MMRGETMRPRPLTTMVSARMAADAGARAISLSMSMGSAGRRREAAVFEPLRETLRPAPDADVVRALAHVERVLALRVDVRLDRRMRDVVFARQIEQDVRHVLVVR